LNLDGAINLEEFRAYLSVRFQEEVHNPWLYSHIVTQELLDSNQRLTVNSGSVDPFDILFYLSEEDEVPAEPVEGLGGHSHDDGEHTH